MKPITKFILEQKQSPYNEIIEYAYSWIDYMYNEGVVDYNDKAIQQIVEGKKKPDYEDVCKGLLSEYDKKLGKKTKEFLNKYLEEKKGLQVEGAINAAFSKFYSDANVELFVNY